MTEVTRLLHPHSVRCRAEAHSRKRALQLAAEITAGAGATPLSQDALFDQLMERALAVDLEAVPDIRLQNTIAQRRARWLMARTGELFLE